jgi:hypothetical protein
MHSPGLVIRRQAGDLHMSRTLGFVLAAAIALAVLGGTVTVFFNPSNEKTDFDPVVP